MAYNAKSIEVLEGLEPVRTRCTLEVQAPKD